MKEKTIQSCAKKLARSKGWLVYKFVSTSNNAVPDDLFAKQGRVFFAEAKATGAKPTALQLSEHEVMRAAGLTVYVYDSREQFAAILALEELYLLDPPAAPPL